MIHTIRTVIRVLRRSKFSAPLPSTAVSGNVCFILGNGPSLRLDLSAGCEFLNSSDVFCVNQFAESDLYAAIKPRYYVLADPSYWVIDESESNKELRSRLIQCMQERTTWSLSLIVPHEGKTFFESEFKDYKNINVFFYNNVPLIGMAKALYKLYSMGWGCPQAQNVLIPTIILAMRIGYKKVVVLGADHSWHETLTLNEMNQVCFKDQHFYNQDARTVPFLTGGSVQRAFTMPAIFFAFAKMFEGYWKVADYAKYLGVEIYNASSKTYIDAFPRVPVSKIQNILKKS